MTLIHLTDGERYDGPVVVVLYGWDFVCHTLILRLERE